MNNNKDVSHINGIDSTELEEFFKSASQVLGIVGDKSLRKLKAQDLASSPLLFESKLIEVDRLSRRIMQFLTLERMAEERTFGTYRQQLEKATKELLGQVISSKEKASNVENEASAFLAIIAQRYRDLHNEQLKKISVEFTGSEWEKLSENSYSIDLKTRLLTIIEENKKKDSIARIKCDALQKFLPSEEYNKYFNAVNNLNKLQIAAEKVKGKLESLKSLLEDDELLLSLTNQLRKYSGIVNRWWASWQARSTVVSIGSLLATLGLTINAWCHNSEIFSLVPYSEWLIANAWKIFIGGLFANFLVGSSLKLMFRELRGFFSPFDPDQVASSVSFSEVEAWFRTRLRRQRYYNLAHTAIRRSGFVLPGILIAVVVYFSTLATKKEVGVLSNDQFGVCLALAGEPVFWFPTYRVYKGRKIYIGRIKDESASTLLAIPSESIAGIVRSENEQQKFAYRQCNASTGAPSGKSLVDILETTNQEIFKLNYKLTEGHRELVDEVVQIKNEIGKNKSGNGASTAENKLILLDMLAYIKQNASQSKLILTALSSISATATKIESYQRLANTSQLSSLTAIQKSSSEIETLSKEISMWSKQITCASLTMATRNPARAAFSTKKTLQEKFTEQCKKLASSSS